MSLETSTFAPGSINSSTKDTREGCGAAASVCRLTEKKRRKLDAAEALWIGQVYHRRITWEPMDHVELRVSDQKELLGDSDMLEYTKFEKKTMTMIREARECFKPGYKYGTLAKEMAGTPGT